MNIIEEVKEHRKNIKYEHITFSLFELVNMYLAEPKEITIRPAFQRLFRWSREQQSNFIESLLLEIPIPPLFFYENEEGTWDLLDGLQRISSTIRFLGAKESIPAEAEGIAGNENEWHYEHQNDLDKPLQLLAGEYLKHMEGLSFKSLPTQLMLNLKRARLHVYVLKRETHPQYKYEVFKRLNRGGSILEEQELRNCSVRLIDDKFAEFLIKIAQDDNFSNTLGLKDEKSRKGYFEELALRYFAMKNFTTHFKHDVSIFLTNYMEEVTRGTTTFDYDKEERLFCRVFQALNKALEPGEGFRAKTEENKSIGPFSPALYEMVTVGVATNIERIESITEGELKNKVIELIKRAKEKSLTGAGSNSKIKTQGRMDLGRNFFAE